VGHATVAAKNAKAAKPPQSLALLTTLMGAESMGEQLRHASPRRWPRTAIAAFLATSRSTLRGVPLP
jgi:hypothetical protein